MVCKMFVEENRTRLLFIYLPTPYLPPSPPPPPPIFGVMNLRRSSPTPPPLRRNRWIRVFRGPPSFVAWPFFFFFFIRIRWNVFFFLRESNLKIQLRTNLLHLQFFSFQLVFPRLYNLYNYYCNCSLKINVSRFGTIYFQITQLFLFFITN